MHLAGRTIDRRSLLIGGGVGVGLLIGWSLWPRRYRPNLRAGEGETIFNAYLKVGDDGRVIVAVPQAELGQGVYTSLPQILADELGADWRTVAVEPAPSSPLYANPLLARNLTSEAPMEGAGGLARWALRGDDSHPAFTLTGGSTSVRAFEPRLREAGAAARSLLAKAAAARWDAEWDVLEVHDGFVWNGRDRISFGELAADAARYDVPGDLPMREGNENRLTGQPLPRLDLPSKVDGSAQFAGDIRLPDMVFASIRQGPNGAGRLLRVDRAAAEKVHGVLTILENPRWAAAVATNWWAANRAVEAMRPGFAIGGTLPSSNDVDRALIRAMESGPASAMISNGDIESALAGGSIVTASYAVGPAPSAALEPLTATARFENDLLEIWAPTQAPGLARAAAAEAIGLPVRAVTLYPTLVGGGYGRKLEMAAIRQAAVIAKTVKRPVQLTWSRIEETFHDSFRPPARAMMTASLERGGKIVGWRARIAAPSTAGEVAARLRGEDFAGGEDAEHAAVAGAMPGYGVGATLIEHVPAPLPIRTGIWRSAAHSYTAFFTESFIDELARQAGIEPFSFRIQLLADNPRLARVLATVTAIGGWNGGTAGSGLGIAAHSAFGSHAALLVEVEVDKDLKVNVTRAVCAVDCGRIINPEIVRQQIEGGILFGIAAATGAPITFEKGLPTALGFKHLGLPTLARSPEVTVELVTSDEPSGGVTELGVPPVAPAIANALFALTGQRLRTLPLQIGSKG
jgi:isoquinoline 1-oxidoreductase beta subunit